MTNKSVAIVSQKNINMIAHISLPVPIDKTFDYLVPENLTPIIGGRVVVSFGRRKAMIGIVVALTDHTSYNLEQLKSIEKVLDDKPLWPKKLYELLLWLSQYYQYPLGETLHNAMPVSLRKGKSSHSIAESFAVKNIENTACKPQLNQEQALAIAVINNNTGFHSYLLEGITGSGKTEVYLNLITPVLEQGKQALVLVPEIGLTPQTIFRFKNRFNVPITVLHSNLTDKTRLQAWLNARQKAVGIIIGTRSALLAPFANLGIIIIDEEHDSSYKQQDSLRYHARDVAIMRAYKEQIPIVLGSATPALETLNNALLGKYHHLILTKRAGGASIAKYKLLDIKKSYLNAGLSEQLIVMMHDHLNRGEQVMLFLNRRGFAPVIMCHDCGWTADCNHCDAYYTFHQKTNEMRCHHCGSQRKVIRKCQHCHSDHFVTIGVGTEQLEQKLAEIFAEYQTIRIDRDSTRNKGSLENALDSITTGKSQILIGTQMLAKGHHFPNVTLVALLDIDSTLYSSDFRSHEKFAQLFVQVAGRAGRASKVGEVVLQTHNPEHPLLQMLINQNYHEFAKLQLEDRKNANLPPYSFVTLIHADSNKSENAEIFLRQVRFILENSPLYISNCKIFGPTPSPVTKRSGKYRWQLLLQINQRHVMQKLLFQAKEQILALASSKKVRWHFDVDAQDLS